ncbi:O-antigen ligase family protein [Desulfosporosinus sp. OT]|uniref:O-antigen ligase family protein n=1 Tax=Desulfosporosinus sp. OT TaxID=913865 RepID=UPI000223A2AD|nr:O-antigen ligase family protein [Desulfosporosinus sp. OT]EGW39925.1 putative membrane protein [Desulfosporosinus sp. OT]
MFWNIGVTRTNPNKLLLIIAIMLSAMILPSFEIHSNLPHVRLDDALIFGAFAINLLLRLTRRSRSVYDIELSYHEGQRKGLRAVTKVFLLFLASIIISNLFGVIFLNVPFGIRDVMEGVTLAKYYLVITLALSLDLQEAEFSVLRKAFLIGFGFILLLAWSQLLNVANVNAWLTPFFAQSHLNNLVDANPPRVLGTFDNPNVMGIVSVLTMTLFVTWFYFQRNDRSRAAILFVATGLALKLTLMTISRTAFLATAVVLTFLSLWAIFKFHFKKEILIKVSLLFILTLTIFYTSPRGFTSRMREATDIDKSTSVIGHLIQMGDAWGYIKQSPVLGWGTAKDKMTTLVDDEYALITRRYGVIGLAMYLWLFLRPAKAAWRRVRLFNFYASEPGIRESKTLLAIAFVAATLVIFVYNLTAGAFYNLQLMTLVALFMGLIYRTEGESD